MLKTTGKKISLFHTGHDKVKKNKLVENLREMVRRVKTLRVCCTPGFREL